MYAQHSISFLSKKKKKLNFIKFSSILVAKPDHNFKECVNLNVLGIHSNQSVDRFLGNGWW